VGRDCTQEREKVIQINEGAIRDHLGALVRSTVEETLNGMLDAVCRKKWIDKIYVLLFHDTVYYSSAYKNSIY